MFEVTHAHACVAACLRFKGTSRLLAIRNTAIAQHWSFR